MKIIDANNWVRNQYEVDSSGLALRNLFNDAYYDPEPQIWVFDGFNSREKRREFYPEYKAKRTPATDAFYEVLKIFKDLIRLTSKVSIEVPGYEADDVIATLIRSNPMQKFHIFSTDRDFAVFHNEYVTQNRPGLEKVDPTEVRLFKTLVGDPSDNIPGVKGFGKKAFADLQDWQKGNWVTYLNGGEVDLRLLGMSQSAVGWVEKNMELLRGFWRIVDFLEVPHDLMTKHTRVGVPNLGEANRILKELFQ